MNGESESVVGPQLGTICARANCRRPYAEHAREELKKRNQHGWAWKEDACPIGDWPFHPQQVFAAPLPSNTEMPSDRNCCGDAHLKLEEMKSHFEALGIEVIREGNVTTYRNKYTPHTSQCSYWKTNECNCKAKATLERDALISKLVERWDNDDMFSPRDAMTEAYEAGWQARAEREQRVEEKCPCGTEDCSGEIAIILPQHIQAKHYIKQNKLRTQAQTAGRVPPQWISVKDSLPEIDEYVLWVQDNGFMFVSEIDKDDYPIGDKRGWAHSVTHWIRLPELPDTPSPASETKELNND